MLAGIGFSLAAYLAFALHDAAVKLAVARLAPAQVLFTRSAVILALCLLIGGRRLPARVLTSPVRDTLLARGLVQLAAWLAYYTAARSLQLAELTTIYFASPLLVAVLAIPLLGERVPWRRWVGIAIGFTGVLIACRPGNLQQPLPIGLALLAASLWAYAIILIRQLARFERTTVQMVLANATFLVACGAAMPWLWRTPSAGELGLLLLIGLFGAAGQFLLLEGMKRAPASVVAPLEFSGLIWSFCLGFLIWGDLPPRAVFVGAGLILASGAFVIGSEWYLTRRARAPLAAPGG